MSRFLIVVPPLVGHINPTIGVATELRALGHEVAFAGAAEVVRALVGDAYPIHDCAIGDRPVRPADARGPAALRFLWADFLVPLAEAMVPGVHAAVAAFDPDLLLVDQQALAGALVADRLGLPWATSATTSAELVDPLAGLPKVADWVHAQLADLAERHGALAARHGALAARPGDPSLSGDLRFSRSLVIAFTTPALAGPVEREVTFVGPSIADRPDAEFAWPTGWDKAVLVTLGTTNADVGERFLSACADALARRSVNAIMVDPAGVLGPQPSHVLVARHVPQLALLPRINAVVCHGGHNTVCEALWHGVPLVVAPIRDDQPIVADQVVAAGAGLRLRFTRSNAEQIGAAIDTVLGEVSFRNAARAVGESFRQAGGARAAAQALAAQVGEDLGMQDKDVARAELVDKLRATYLADLADGVDRFFEPRREQCPWCESANIEVALRTTDLLQHKPGRFVIDRCRDCGHRFQNPRLNGEGLEFYYRDCYDGLGEETMNKLFSAKDDTYVQRANALKPFAQPASWLDIGTGHGHFPHLAKQVFPDTEFDGLDQSAGVDLARDRGWIGTGYRGEFVDLTPDLTEKYAAVSMFHYLEHTPYPRRQLEAAVKVLRPGGHLVIEVPDPESRWGRVLGRWWVPWLQPQHLNFIPIANLREALTGLGFTVLAEQRAEAHGGYDLLPALLLLLHAALTRGDDVPWRRKPPSRLARFVRTAGFRAAMPLFIASAIADRVLAGFVGSRGYANAYRVVAVKN